MHWFYSRHSNTSLLVFVPWEKLHIEIAVNTTQVIRSIIISILLSLSYRVYTLFLVTWALLSMKHGNGILWHFFQNLRIFRSMCTYIIQWIIISSSQPQSGPIPQSGLPFRFMHSQTNMHKIIWRAGLPNATVQLSKTWLAAYQRSKGPEPLGGWKVWSINVTATAQLNCSRICSAIVMLGRRRGQSPARVYVSLWY